MTNTRISLVEQYNNKDVITQIAILTDKVESSTDEIDNAVQTAQNASAKADSAASKAELAQTSADKAQKTADQAVTDSATAKTDASSALSKAEESVHDALIKTDATSGNLYIERNDGGQYSNAIPIASATATGLMNAQTFKSLTDLGDRVSALENKETIVYVTLPSTSPTQAQITTVFAEAAGRQPVAGDICMDIAKALSYQYDGSKWVVTQQVAAPWSNTTAGLVKGSESGAGTIFAETDGTGSVNGWDDLTTKVDNNATEVEGLKARATTDESAIQANTAAIQSNGAAIDDLKKTTEGITAGKQEKLGKGTVSLVSSGWSGSGDVYIQTASSSIVTKDNIVWVAPADNIDTYGRCGVYASAQEDGVLTFTATKVPSVTLTVSIVTAS